jgi:pyruvate,orthophosphate dikinase
MAAGFCSESGASLRLTLEGRRRLSDLLAEERTAVNEVRLTGLYEEFDTVNNELKAIITAWQMRGDQTLNDHTDPGYDQSVIERLAALHSRFSSLLGQVVAEAPRLAHYPARFDGALHRVLAGEHRYVAAPVIDSYHTVWFELHEELIGLLGRTRADEAKAGRAV